MNFFKWMQAGLAGAAQAVIQAVSGGHFGVKALALGVLGALVVRAAGYVVARYGPAPLGGPQP